MAKVIVKTGYIKSLEHAANLIDYAGNKLEAQELVLEDGSTRPINDAIYLEYISTRPGVELGAGQHHGLWTLTGDADMEAEKQRLREHPDSIRWSQIISLSREDAERTGFDNRAAWQRLIRARAADFAKLYNIRPEHLVVNAAYHDKDYHPHVHLLFYSTDKREGFVPDMAKASERFKSLFFNEIFHEDVAHLKERKTEQRRELDQELEKALTRLYSKDYSPPGKLPARMLDLSERLSEVSGKKVYGYLPPELKQTVGGILKNCIEDDPHLRKIYNLYMDTQRAFVRQYMDDPAKIATRMQDCARRFLEPGKNDSTRLHNIIIEYAVRIGYMPAGPDDQTVQENPPVSPPAAETAAPDELDRLIERAEQGDDFAQYQLGKRLLHGKGLPRNQKLALEVMRMSADAGNPYAAYETAKMYRDGIGTEANELQKDAYFYKARTEYEYREGQTHDDRLQYRLGVMCEKGEGRDINLPQAVEYYTLAAAQENAFAQYALAEIYLAGGEISRDEAAARDLLTRAASQGHMAAQCRLGRLLLEHPDEDKMNVSFGLYFLRQAAAAGSRDAKQALSEYGIHVAATPHAASGGKPGRKRDRRGDGMWTAEYKEARAWLRGIGREREYKKAWPLMEREAGTGNPLACYDAGFMCQNGLGVKMDAVAAQKWYRKAYDGFCRAEVQNHNAYIQYRIGKMCRYGQGVDPSDTDAANWFRLAADQGNQYAQYSLGGMHRDGKGVDQDYTAAFQLFHASAGQGNAFASYELARLYRDGKGVVADPQAAAEQYRRAFNAFAQIEKDTGDDNIQYRLGRMCLNGEGTGKDEKAAVLYFEKSAELGNANAQYQLARLWLFKPKYAEKVQEAVKWLKKSAGQNNVLAQYTLGKLYVDGEAVPKDTAQGVAWLKKAAGQDNDYAMYRLGTLYLSGETGRPDMGKAVAWFTQAAGLNNQYAQYRLGRLYIDGEVVTQDISYGVSLLEKAAAQGNDPALYRLGCLYLDGKVVTKDVDKGLAFLKRTADNGNEFAQYRLGREYYRGENVPKDEELAKSYLSSSAKQGNQYAQRLLDYIHGHPARKAAYAASLMLRSLAYVIVGDSRREASYSEHNTSFHQSQVRRKFTLHLKHHRPVNISDDISY